MDNRTPAASISPSHPDQQTRRTRPVDVSPLLQLLDKQLTESRRYSSEPASPYAVCASSQGEVRVFLVEIG